MSDHRIKALRKISRSTDLPITLAEAIEIFKGTSPDDDLTMTKYLTNAFDFVESETGLTLIRTVYELRLPCFEYGRDRCCNGRIIELQATPVRDVQSVKYYDQDDTLQTVGEDQYFWERTDQGAWLYLKSSFSLPALSCNVPNPVRITFECGVDPQGDSPAPDPELLFPPRAEQAILLLTGHWFEHRENASERQNSLIQNSARDLIASLRIYT